MEWGCEKARVRNYSGHKNACWPHAMMTPTSPLLFHLDWGPWHTCVHTGLLIIMHNCNRMRTVAWCSTHVNISSPHWPVPRHQQSKCAPRRLLCPTGFMLARGQLYSQGPIFPWDSHSHILRPVSSKTYFLDEAIFHYLTQSLWK